MTVWRRWRGCGPLAASLGLAALSGIAACGGSGGAPDATSSVNATETPGARTATALVPPGTATPARGTPFPTFEALPGQPQAFFPWSIRTGDRDVDTLLDALGRGDSKAIVNLTAFQVIACREPGSAAPQSPAPICPPDVAAGTPIPVVPLKGCHGSDAWLAEQLAAFVERAPEDLSPYAVFAAADGSKPGFAPDAHFIVILVRRPCGAPPGRRGG